MSEDLKYIKELREKTGAGFLDCKQALKENNNNIESSIDFLRKKGLAKASKKSSREAKEGAIGIYSNNDFTTLIKVNSETDFAAKGDTFLDFLNDLGKFAIESNDVNLTKDKFLSLEIEGKLISDHFNDMIAKIGENIILNDLIVIEHNDQKICYYVHNGYRENIGKIISVIKYSAKKIDSEIENLSKNICMHIAALKPEAIDENNLDPNLIEKEKNIQKELIASSGKPDNIIEKILAGKMKKFFSEVTLLNQSYVIDPEKTVKEILDDYSNEYLYKLHSFKLLNLI